MPTNKGAKGEVKNKAIKISKKKIGKSVYEFILFLFSAIFLYPFYAVITLSLKSPSEALMRPMSIPRTINISNYIEAWKIMDYSSAFVSSLIITLFSSLGIVIVSGMCAFSIARKQSVGYSILYYLIISGLMVPFYMTLSPLIKLMRELGFMDSYLGIILAYVGRSLPFAILMYVGFIRNISKEISDSAVIDGCTPFKMYWLIFFPMIKHITTALIILNVLWIWNDFLFPLLTIQSKAKMTIPVVQFHFYGMYASSWNLAFASYILSMAPLLIVYFLLQRNIIEGITAGSVKG